MKNLMVTDPELVIGLVGRLGVDTKNVSKLVSEQLRALHYDSVTIKITDYLKTKKFEIDVKDQKIEERYESYIDACNHIREKANRNDFFVSYAIQRIINERFTLTGSETEPAPRQAYIIDQIKRPEEAEAFRKVYGKQFVLISCHMTIDRRVDTLSRKIAEGHAQLPKFKEWETEAKSLIARDENESNKPYGQRVADVFPKADVIVSADKNEETRNGLKRFFEALFGNFRVSPTKSEFLQNIAFQSALTSCDTARQVGAVTSRDGDIISTGFNEAPKAFGGTYWAEDGEDGRDIYLGKDINTVRKRHMVIDIVRTLLDAKLLVSSKIDLSRLEEQMLDVENAPLKKTQIMDTLEYGRAVHAEMAAITSAARLGLSLKGASLHCTTFPCHNCSKHIVASGIKTVFYLEPYNKSFTDELHPDSVEIDTSKPSQDKVQFRQFVGITQNRYADIFAKSKLKDKKGTVVDWDKARSQPIIGKLDQAHIDREVLFQKELVDSIGPSIQEYLGLA
jgi:cytidine deaminase